MKELNRLRIAEAIIHYRQLTGQKMNQSRAGNALTQKNNGGRYLSQWNQGNEVSRITAQDIIDISTALKVDANFLYGVKPNKHRAKFDMADFIPENVRRLCAALKTDANSLIGTPKMK